jgi:hypothetical protein
MKDSLKDDFYKIDFSKYPVLGIKEKNQWAKNMKKLVAIYSSMINCFEDSEIKSAFQQISNSLVDTLEKKILTVNIKIENENAAKQYNNFLI